MKKMIFFASLFFISGCDLIKSSKYNCDWCNDSFEFSKGYTYDVGSRFVNAPTRQSSALYDNRDYQGTKMISEPTKEIHKGGRLGFLKQIDPKKNASSFSRIKVHCSRSCANEAADAEIDKETQGYLWKEWREYKKNGFIYLNY